MSFLRNLLEWTQRLSVGSYDQSPEPFMGPVISNSVVEQLLAFQEKCLSSGAKALLKMERQKTDLPFVTPAILDVTEVKGREDVEFFGPLLQVIRVNDLDEAIKEANNTEYGLSAGIFTSNEAQFEKFYQRINAGIVNWNRPLTGASSASPFGGTGCSGKSPPQCLLCS